MSRVKFLQNGQRSFLKRIGKYFHSNWHEITRITGISERSLRDWRCGKYNMSSEALTKLCRISGISVPKSVKILPEYWSARKFARKGGLKRYQMYGGLGTPEGRRRGGISTQKLFRSNPEYAKSIGIIMRKDIKRPKPSIELAEFIF